jgi:hypothetical protein
MTICPITWVFFFLFMVWVLEMDCYGCSCDRYLSTVPVTASERQSGLQDWLQWQIIKLLRLASELTLQQSDENWILT